jgi:transcriptional regulator with XRE-family HTH domain
MPITVLSPGQLKKQIANQAKQKRLDKNLSRETLGLKSNVPMSTIKRFETTGNISLDALLRIALVLDCLNEFSELFASQPPLSLYQAFSNRKRGRQ